MSAFPNLSNLDALKDLVEMSLEEARKQGATQAAAEVSEDAGLNINVRDGEADVIEHTRDRSFAVTVYIGKKMGRASSGDFTPASIRQTVKAAAEIAKYVSEDECAGLPDSFMLCREPQDLDLYHPWDLSPEKAIEICAKAEKAGFDFDSRIFNSDGINLNSSAGKFVLGNTEGFLAGYPYTNHSLYASLIGENKDGMQRDYGFTTSVDYAKLKSPEEIGREAARRTVERLSPRSLSPRECPVIFEARAADHLIRALASAASGSKLYRKASFLVKGLGKPVLSEKFSLFEDPFAPATYGSDPFDEEGVAGSRRFIVEEGELRGYFLSSYTARKLGMQTTGNAGGPYNLMLMCSPKILVPSLKDLVRTMDKGLVVTELTGEGINLITGDYSRGCSGFWVENGEIQYPVDGVTIAGNLKEMLMGLTAMADDANPESSVLTGSVLIDRMTIAGNTEG